jgi:hypothetical protein
MEKVYTVLVTISCLLSLLSLSAKIGWVASRISTHNKKKSRKEEVY